MKGVLKGLGIIIGSTAVIAAIALAYDQGCKQEEEYSKELCEHVIETWQNAPEDFHGHECKYGDWCTRSFYEFLTREKK